MKLRLAAWRENSPSQSWKLRSHHVSSCSGGTLTSGHAASLPPRKPGHSAMEGYLLHHERQVCPETRYDVALMTCGKTRIQHPSRAGFVDRVVDDARLWISIRRCWKI